MYFAGGFSLAAGVSVMSIPTSPRPPSPRRAQPTSYREAAEAPGYQPAGRCAYQLKTAMPGIVTGMLVALALAIGDGAAAVHRRVSKAADRTTHRLAGRLPDLTNLDVPTQVGQDPSYDAAPC